MGEAQNIELRLSAVCSVPRVGWTDMWDSTLAAVHALGIPTRLSQGAYWGQCLERALGEAVDAGHEAVLVLDYDSVFTVGQLTRLLQIFAHRPDIDALAPVQVGRGKREVMFSTADSAKATVDDQPLRASTAHFGLTLLRTAALARMPHPWFYATPAPNGAWGEGRKDEDIAFWHKWSAAGNTLYIDTRTCIGHLEVMVADLDEAGSVQHLHPSEWRAKHLEAA